jgi:16S rRNA (uracil1498-N3)-methyltransferase
MTRRRFYVPRDLIQNDRATLPRIQAHHLRSVLRLHTGDRVEIFDGAGSGYAGEVELQASGVLIRALQPIPSSESPFHVTLAAALIKPARYEWILEKSTELGVHEIIPLKTAYSEFRVPPDKMESRLERWRRIVREASRQCARFTEPRIAAPLNIDDFFASQGAASSTRILFYEKSDKPFRLDSPISDRIVLCVGPEGGWEPREIESAVKVGFQVCGLGPRILRAETAAVTAIAIIQHQIQLLTSKSPCRGNPEQT